MLPSPRCWQYGCMLGRDDSLRCSQVLAWWNMEGKSPFCRVMIPNQRIDWKIEHMASLCSGLHQCTMHPQSLRHRRRLFAITSILLARLVGAYLSLQNHQIINSPTAWPQQGKNQTDCITSGILYSLLSLVVEQHEVSWCQSQLPGHSQQENCNAHKKRICTFWCLVCDKQMLLIMKQWGAHVWCTTSSWIS